MLPPHQKKHRKNLYLDTKNAGKNRRFSQFRQKP